MNVNSSNPAARTATRARRPGVSRRQFLAGAAGAGGPCGRRGGLTAQAALASTRGGGVCAAPSPSAGMPSLAEVWRWQEQLVRFGTRYTGSRGHDAFVGWLTEQLSAVPGFKLRTDRLTFNRWLARDFALRVRVPATVGRSGPVPLTYYYPYSGQTPRGGVTGKLVDLGALPAGSSYTAAFWAPAKGGIALVRTALPVFSLDVGQTAIGGYEPGKTSAQAAADYTAYASALTHPAWQGIFEPVPLLDAKNTGVLGVVCVWTGLPDDEVINQYNPFTTGYPAPSGLATPGDPGCPAVWVGDSTGAELSRLAASGEAAATLVLTADITAGAATETVWGWLKGSGDTGQNIIINTHTDGPNATEENGGLGLVALARHLAGLAARNHDMYFALVTGHFQLPQFIRAIPNPKNTEVGSDAISAWMLDHPDIYQAAALGVTVEHLGATMWTNDPVTGRYAANRWFRLGHHVHDAAGHHQPRQRRAGRLPGRGRRGQPAGLAGLSRGHRAARRHPAVSRRGSAAVRRRARHGLPVPAPHLPAAGRRRAAARSCSTSTSSTST